MKTPWWFRHKTPLAFILWPVSWVYYMFSRMVYGVRKIRAYTPRRAVVCVGNILAGGVGKTPIVRAIAEYLDAPVVMRGYKAKKSANPILGDEATMLSAHGLTVHTGHRKSNVMLMDRQADKTPIVMDDGLQNPTVKKTISIMVFDDGLGYGNGFLLPAGPLRVRRSHAARADAIIVIKSNRPRRKFTLPVNVPVFYAVPKTINPYRAGVRLVAFAGIGYPGKFFDALGDAVVARRAFADHYQYTADDIKKLFALAKKKKAELITTEKDWVRLSADVREKIKFAPLSMNIDKKFFEWLDGELKKCQN